MVLLFTLRLKSIESFVAVEAVSTSEHEAFDWALLELFLHLELSPSFDDEPLWELEEDEPDVMKPVLML